ncbi:MAG: ATP-binding protein, partial [Candidatus Thorarchaeota archaeon]
RYNKELMAHLEEGMMIAVRNFKGQAKSAKKKGVQRYTVMVISKVWPLHYGLGGISDSHYYPMQMEMIEQAVPDWDTDDQATMMVHLTAIPINYDLIIPEKGEIEFRKGFSYPLIGDKVHVINLETIDLIYNGRVREALLRMFMDSEKEVPVLVDLYKLLRYHFGVFSFTGGGKSNLLSNLFRRILYHTKDTKLVIFDVSCEYPFLMSDVFSDPKIQGKVIVEEEPRTAEDFARSIVKPRDFEDDPRANSALTSLYDLGMVTYYNLPQSQMPTYRSVLDDINDLQNDNSSKPTYVQALDQVKAAVAGWMDAWDKSEGDPLDNKFVDMLHKEAVTAVEEYSVYPKSGVAAWASTRGKLKDAIARTRSGKKKGVTVKDLLKMMSGPERVICISIADPDILRDIVIRMTASALKYRKRSFEIKPQILFVFDEAQEFIPSNATGQVARCSSAVERLLRQGRKYGLGGAIATQRIAYLNTNIMQQLHTFFVGTLPRPYDRTVVSSSFQIDLSILDKTLEFPPGSWLLSSYIAMGIDNVPVFVKADNAEDTLQDHIAAIAE